MLTGCWDRTEINNLGLVSGAGFDRTKDKTVEMSIQLTPPSDGSTVVKVGTGQTAADAMSQLQEEVARDIFWGHCNIFIIGKSEAKEGISDLIDFIMRFPHPRERSYVFVSNGTARSNLELHTRIERNSAEALQSEVQLQWGVTVKELWQLLQSKDQAMAIPTIEKLQSVENPEGNRTIPIITGTAILKEDKLVGTVNKKVTKGILWVRNDMQNKVITFHPDNSQEFASVRIIRSRTKLIPQIKQGMWEMIVDISVEGELIQMTGKRNAGKTPEISELETPLSQGIESTIMTAIDKIKGEMNADVFGFSEQFHRVYPQEWKKVKGHWDDKLPEIKVHTRIKAKIVRSGLVS